MRAVITGASSGIGKEFAHILAQKGYNLTLIARRKDKLEDLSKILPVSCKIIVADLSDIENVKKVYEAAKGKDVEIVINNAGFGLFGNFFETNLETELKMIQTNIVAVHVLTKLFLKDFKKQNKGYILNVASSAGFMAGPLMSTYYASKNYVLRLSQAISQELKQENSNVKVCALCPGPVKTEFNDVANVKFSIGGIDSRFVAKYAIDKMLTGKTIIIPSITMKILIAAKHLVPESLMPKITYYIQSKKGE